MAQGRSTKIISMIKWIRTGRLSMKNSLFNSSPFPEQLKERVAAWYAKAASLVPDMPIDALFVNYQGLFL